MESLVALCREHPLREKILVVPSLAVGHQITDRIAQEGLPWINLRVETVRTLADAVAGFALTREGITVLSRAQALALVERACDEALDEESYFAAVADRPGLHRALQRSLDDLRMAGARPESVPSSSFESPRKAEDLERILVAYERRLAEGSFADRSGVLDRAITILKGGGRAPFTEDAVWTVLDEPDRKPREKELLNLITGGRAPVTLDLPSPAIERELASGDSLHFVRAVGEENEIRGALRSILDRGTAFDDAELVYTDRNSYLALAFELTSEYGVASTFAEGIAASFTRPGMAVLGFLSWVGGGFEAVAIQDIVRAGAVNLSRFAPESSPVTSRGVVRILRQAAIGWGRARYLPRLQALLAEKRTLLDDPDLNEVRRRSIERELAGIERVWSCSPACSS